MVLKQMSVQMNGDQPADDWRRSLEANPKRWMCPEREGVGTGMSEASAQSSPLPSALQMAGVWQVPENVLMLSSLYLFRR